MHPYKYMHRYSMHARAFMRKTWPWGKLLQISWDTLIQYGTRNKCIAEQGINIYYLINYFPGGPNVTSAHDME